MRCEGSGQHARYIKSQSINTSGMLASPSSLLEAFRHIPCRTMLTTTFCSVARHTRRCTTCYTCFAPSPSGTPSLLRVSCSAAPVHAVAHAHAAATSLSLLPLHAGAPCAAACSAALTAARQRNTHAAAPSAPSHTHTAATRWPALLRASTHARGSRPRASACAR